MNNSFRFGFSALLCLAFLTGCGSGNLAPVSGVVTVNGKPTENVRVVFAPMATDDTSTPGPPSLGVTDAEGRYELKTRDGDGGAVAGAHTVTFTYSDLEHLEDLRSWLSNAESDEDAAAAQAKIDHVESEIEIRGAISKSSKQKIIIAAGGKSDADFEIGEDGE